MKALKRLLYLFIVLMLISAVSIKKIYRHLVSPPRAEAVPKIFVIPKERQVKRLPYVWKKKV
jgi:hypothetical protein